MIRENEVREMVEIYDARKDKEFQNGYIDQDETRVRKLEDGTEIPFRYMHGGFKGTPIRFSFCFPEKEKYEGRFYQYLSPFPGPEEELASLPVSGIDDKIAFCLTHGAYYVESNMGSEAIFVNSDDNTMTHRASALSAEFSRIKAQEVYGYAHRPYGYVYGGSGGGYRTIACMENTNAFDGGIPYVIGSPYAIPNCQTTRAHAERILRDKLTQIIDAVDSRKEQIIYENLTEEEADAFREATLFGYPLKSWFVSADMNDGSLPVLLPGIKQMDPTYFDDFWKVSGYLGANSNGSAVRDRICMDTAICSVCDLGSERSLSNPDGKEKEIDTRNGVNDAWKKMIGNSGEETEPWIELEKVPVSRDEHSLYLQGSVLSVLTGRGAGKKVQLKRIEGSRVYLAEGYGTDSVRDVIALMGKGDKVHLDNSDYIAVQTYHRHQIPEPEYKAWDQFRDADGKPLYPQRDVLIGPAFAGQGPGCEQNGCIQGKIIIVAALMDEQAYPWQADWYRRKVSSVCGCDENEVLRLWYFDNALHDDKTDSADELHATSYMGGLKQALIDIADWVEKGKAPLPSSNYKVDVGNVIVPQKAKERRGIQPVARLWVNEGETAHVKVGEKVYFCVEGEVPDGAGSLTFVEWSFEGESDFPEKGEWELTEGGKYGIARAVHTYMKPGVYYAVVRIKSERNGEKSALYTQVRNIDRIKIVVEGKEGSEQLYHA